jgi:5-hydroxyisourate hydrolase-like protein (transthyretin family)
LQEKTAQAINTDHNGRATFTVDVGSKSDLGIYDTELEVAKDSFQSSFEQIDFRVV